MLECDDCRRSWLDAETRQVAPWQNVVKAIRFYLLVIGTSAFVVTRAMAQLPPPTVVPPVPNLNPSSSLLLPQSRPVPISPGLSGGGSAFIPHSYHTGCSVFRRGPVFRITFRQSRQDLRLIIVSTDESATTTDKAEATGADDRSLDPIRDMFAALRACWVPPPKGEAHHGMEWTIRFAFRRDGTMIAVPLCLRSDSSSA
jgi:hypothetical protein